MRGWKIGRFDFSLLTVYFTMLRFEGLKFILCGSAKFVFKFYILICERLWVLIDSPTVIHSPI